METELEPPVGRWQVSLALFLVGAAVAWIALFSAVPGRTGGSPPAPTGASTGWSPTPRLVCNNARLGGVFRLSVLAGPERSVWVLASSNSGPSQLGPWQVALGPDWLPLLSAAWTSGGDRASLTVPVPNDPAWEGTEALVQALVHDPFGVTWEWSEPVLHRFSRADQGGRSVLLIRQATILGTATYATGQADALAQLLGAVGHEVTVVDDAVPADLASYDVLLDCRFNLPPMAEELDRMTDFLRHRGGVFVLAGPGAGSPEGQWRVNMIRGWFFQHLGLPLAIATGIDQSNGGLAESVYAGADPEYLQIGVPLADKPYAVEFEGGHFGSVGTAPVGSPWIVGPPGPFNSGPTVYGMQFRPGDLAIPAMGRVAVLLNGAPDALVGGPNNPWAAAIMQTLVWWLDS